MLKTHFQKWVFFRLISGFFLRVQSSTLPVFINSDKSRNPNYNSINHTHLSSCDRIKRSIGWSSPTFFSINMISPNSPELVYIWRIRCGVNGPVIWVDLDGISLKMMNNHYFQTVFHVDASAQV